MNETPAEQIPNNVRIQRAVSAWLQKFPMPIRVILSIGIFILWLVLFIVALPFLALLGVFVYCKHKVIICLPIKYQRKYYERYKSHLITNVAPKLGPMIAYPFCAFIELELDKHFETGGMREVLKQIDGFGDRMMRRFENIKQKVLDKIGEGVDKTEMVHAMGMGMLFDSADFEPGHEQSHGWIRSTPIRTDVSMASKNDELAAAVAALNAGQHAPSDKKNVDS